MGGSPSHHEVVYVPYVPPPDQTRVDEAQQMMDEEKKSIQEMMKWGEKLNKKFLAYKSWPTEVMESLPERIPPERRDLFVTYLPWIIFSGVSLFYLLCQLISAWYHGGLEGHDNSLSGPYRRGLAWILVMMDAVFIVSLLGTAKAFQLLMDELRVIEKKVPLAIDSFRDAVMKLERGTEKALLKAAHALKCLFRLLIKAQEKVDETANHIHNKVNSGPMKCFCGSLVKKVNDAEDQAMSQVNSGFREVFMDEEIAELIVDQEEFILDRVMSWEDKTLMPMEKQTALHIISIMQKDVWLAFRIIISCQSILVFWTTFHFLDILVFG